MIQYKELMQKPIDKIAKQLMDQGKLICSITTDCEAYFTVIYKSRKFLIVETMRTGGVDRIINGKTTIQ